MGEVNMGTRKKKAIADNGVVPAYVQASKLLQRHKVTKRTLPSYTEAMMMLHAPESLRLFWKALMEGMDSGDEKFVRLCAEVFDLVKKGGGITITQQLLQQNVAAGELAPVQGYDSLVRKLAEVRAEAAAEKALPSPSVIEIRPADFFESIGESSGS
jgi:hypothetical protein